MLTLSKTKQQGITLIEALVAMVVLSVGMLGIAGLQINAIKYSYSSYQKTLATLQAKDLTDRLWSSSCALPDARNQIRDDWISVHQNSLPNWNGVLAYTAPIYTISISWSDNRQSLDSSTQTFSYAAQIPPLPCS